MSSPEQSIKDRILEAILKRIEGAKDLKKRLDYLMNPDNLSSSARLSEMQVQAVSECNWLGSAFPSLKPLAEFVGEYAKWTISREGKGREEVVTVMVSENREGVTAMGLPVLPFAEKKEGKEKGKEKTKA